MSYTWSTRSSGLGMFAMWPQFGAILVSHVALVLSLVTNTRSYSLLTLMYLATNIQFYFPLMGEGAALCICRQLEWIWSTRGTTSARPRRTMFEISLCFIVPL